MKLYAQLTLAAALAVGGLASVGCTVQARGPDVVVGPPPVGYVYEDDYYARGHWDGDYWMWRDRDGHFFREAARHVHGRACDGEITCHDDHDDTSIDRAGFLASNFAVSGSSDGSVRRI